MSSSQAAAADSLVGNLIADKYKIVRVIGKGGMGVVYEGVHVELNKRVAIKMMLEKYADDGEAVARFRREAFAATKIGNPHIIDVQDIGSLPDGRAFCVMEYLDGSSLGDVIKASGNGLPPVRAIYIMRQVLRAVGAAHAKGIIHRDLKPDNIFLVNQDEQTQDFVKLLDFGISKFVDTAAEIAATRLTTTGMVMGTPLYMSPEQAMGEVAEQGADIYALGVILYEMLAGRPPFDGATYPILVAKLLTADPPLLSESKPGTPPSLVASVHRALEKDPKRRFASCDAFAAALPNAMTTSSLELAKTLDSGSVMAVKRPTRAASGKSKLPLIIGGIGAGLAVGAVALILMTRGNNPAAATDEKGLVVAPIESGILHITSTPSGAAVKIDDKLQDKPTPLQITVTAGKHRVRVELDGAFVEQDVSVGANSESSAVLSLPAVPPPQNLGSGSAAPLVVGVGSGSSAKGPAIKGPKGGVKKTGAAALVTPQTLPHVEPLAPGMTAPPVVNTPPEKTVPKNDPKPQNPYDTKPQRRSNPYQ